MKRFSCALALLLVSWSVPSWAQTAHDFFPICTAPPTSATRTLIVDPSGGKPGTQPGIAAALKVAKPGDTIDLMTGDYGELNLTGVNQGGFITIEAAPGQSPRFTKLTVGGYNGRTSHWRLIGLTISGFSTGRWANGAVAHKGLVAVMYSDNIILERNNVFSQAGDFNWQSELVNPDVPAVSDGFGVDQASCISLVENHISNVFNGMLVGGDQTEDRGKYFLVMGNTIDNFAGDGIDHSASRLRILHNRITNGHDICENKCVHTDGIQGWNWHDKAGLVDTDVVIDSNVIIAQTKPGLAWPADDLHGITIFDGRWDGLQISNNLIVTDTWHGITVYGAVNTSVINNTVASTNPKRDTWININADKNDPPDTRYNFVVRNNVAPSMNIGKREAGLPGVIIDHNLKLDADDYAGNFVKFDPEHFAYDLHPTKRSDVRGEGSAEGAPSVDIEGKPRQGKIDIGAYAYQGN